MDRKRVLITGPTGFIGQHCLGLLSMGDVTEIHAVNRSGTGPFSSRVTWHAADLLGSGEINRLFADIRPTHLLHCAWIATPGVYLHSADNQLWLDASTELFQCFGAAGGQRLVAVGSSAEYSSTDRLCKEDKTPTVANSLYATSKVKAWLALARAAEVYKFSAAWGRVFLPYGPGDLSSRLIPSVVRALNSGQPLAVTAGEQIRDFIYAPDAADLLVQLLQSTEVGAFNVGTGTGTSIRAVIEKLGRLCAATNCAQFGALADRPGDPKFLVADMDKVHSLLGWTAPTSLDVGLAKFVLVTNLQ